MANYQLLKADIDEKVYENAQQKITGANLNSVLNAMVSTLGAEYQFAGVATKDTNPETTDAKVFYIANGKGTYTNFGSLEVTEDEVVVLYWDTAWHKVSTGIASQAKLSELDTVTKQKVDIKIGKNLIDATDFKNGYFFNANGEIKVHNSFALCEKYIKIEPNTRYCLSAESNLGESQCYCVFYDENKNFISATATNYVLTIILETPSNASYIRISIYASTVTENIMLEKGEKRTSYESYNTIGGYISTLNNKVNDIESEVTHIETNGIPEALYKESYEQPVQYELGNITIGASWEYSNSNTRVRTPQGYELHLFEGDVIGLSDYSNARIYIGIQKDGLFSTSGGWRTEDFIMPYDGYVCFVISNLVDEKQSSPDELGRLIKVVHKNTLLTALKDLNSSNQDIGLLVKGEYRHSFTVLTQEHSAAKDLLPVQIKSGDRIKVTLYQGTGVCDSSSLKIRFYNDGMINTDNFNSTFENEITCVATRDASYIGIYLYKITKGGTFYFDVKNVTQIERNENAIIALENSIKNKGSFVSLLAHTKQPNIDTVTRQLVINRGSLIVYNDDYYLIPNDTDIFVDLSGIPTSNKKVIFDKSNNSFSCVSYSTPLTDTQGVLMLIKTDYNATGAFTKVFFVSCPFDVTIDGIVEHQQGTIVGYGKISIQSKFAEISHNLTITQTIFDTETYSVGVQSFGIHQNKYAIYIINATDKSNALIQKIGAVIVDLESKEKIGEFVIQTTNTTMHGNNMNLGEKYDENDILPLAYISASYTPFECIVIRVANDFSTFTNIQTIVYSGTSHFVNKRTIDWIVDGKYIWAYGSYWDDNNEYIEFVKFLKPSIGTPNVTLSDADVIDSFTVQGLRIAQGAIIKNDKIFIGLGYTPGVEFIKVVNTQTHAVETVMPISYEPEGVSILNDQLAITSSGYSIKTYIDAY